jgi:signal transduction histidine kinase
MAQEAPRNASKHAHAERVAVKLWREPGKLRLHVRDHGRSSDGWLHGDEVP